MDYNEEYQNTFTLIENNVFYDLELKHADVRVYGCVRSLACNGKGYCFASNAYIAKRIGISASYVQKSLKTLADKGYIKTEILYKENSKEVAQRRIRTFTLTNEFNYKTLEQQNPPTSYIVKIIIIQDLYGTGI